MEPGQKPSESPISDASGVELVAPPSASRSQDAKPEEAAAKKRHDRPFYLKRYKAGSLLFALFLIMIFGAALLYPRRPPVNLPAPLNISINTAGTVEAVHVAVLPTSGLAVPSDDTATFGLVIGLEISMPVELTPSYFTPDLTITNIPRSFRPVNCHRRSTQDCVLQPGLGGQDLITTGNSTLMSPSNGKRIWNVVFTVSFAGSAVAWDTNGLEAEAQLPKLSIDPTGNPVPPKILQFTSSDPNVQIDYYTSELSNYDWTGGPEPAVIPSQSCSFCVGGHIRGYVEWIEPLNALSAPVPVSGTNNSAAEWDSFRTFAAGALVGIAGGALVGAVQEATHRKDKVAPAPSSSPQAAKS